MPIEPTPSCPACGGTPASLTEDGYSTDLTPWWKHCAQKFNPFRLTRRKTEMRWTPTEGDDEHLWDEHEYVALLVGGDNAVFPFVIVTSRQVPVHEDVLERVTHYCPLPPTP